jgi:hypothetical protein
MRIVPTVLAVVVVWALLGHSQSLPVPRVLYPNPLGSSYPRTAQIATVSDIGKITLIPGSRRERIEVKFLADGGWMYVCNAPSLGYIRTLTRGDRVSIQPHDKYIQLKTTVGENLRLKIIDVSRWARL